MVPDIFGRFLNPRGFTMLEIVIVIALLGILMSVGVSSYTGSLRRGRDARRKTDLETLRQALEIYKSDNNSYPDVSTGNANNLDGATGPLVSPTQYISENNFPKDPQQSTGQYYYYRRNSTSTYDVCASLEVAETSPNTACTSVSCGTTACNYGLTQP